MYELHIQSTVGNILFLCHKKFKILFNMNEYTETHRSKNIIDVIQILKINCVRYNGRVYIARMSIRRAKRKWLKISNFICHFKLEFNQPNNWTFEWNNFAQFTFVCIQFSYILCQHGSNFVYILVYLMGLGKKKSEYIYCKGSFFKEYTLVCLYISQNLILTTYFIHLLAKYE